MSLGFVAACTTSRIIFFNIFLMFRKGSVFKYGIKLGRVVAQIRRPRLCADDGFAQQRHAGFIIQ